MKKELPDGWLATLFEHGVDLPNRRVFLGEITDESALKVAQGMYALETEDDETHIDLFINSPGGCLDSVLGIYDIINTLRCPVHTFASGICMSAAPLLLVAGEPGNRWVSPHVRLMLHDYSTEIEGKGREIKQMVKESEYAFGKYLDIMTEHTNKPRSFWKRLTHKAHDHYFSSEEAIEWGMADSIWVQRG